MGNFGFASALTEVFAVWTFSLLSKPKLLQQDLIIIRTTNRTDPDLIGAFTTEAAGLPITFSLQSRNLSAQRAHLSLTEVILIRGTSQLKIEIKSCDAILFAVAEATLI